MFDNIDLQLFADEGVNDGDVADLQNDTNDEQNDEQGDVQDAGESDNNDGVADQKPVQSQEENAKYAAARREAEAQLKAIAERQNNFARMYGFNSFEEMEHAALLQQYTNQGYSPVEAEMKARLEVMEQRMAMRENNARIAEEKAALKDAKYFKELEPEIDRLLAANPALNVEAVYTYVRGKKLDELLTKETAATKQKTLNQIGSKQHLKTEGDGEGDIDTVNIPAETLQMYADMGMSKKEAVAHYKKLYK